ncbi:hypothetical protein GCM10022288_14150 [Gryllotalpicola kribbensis]|jgi:uncharacterized membrane protein|uniref:DUF2269 family protein n=1 Tax=Gryllotalpicola kribbensis TaxID=993084 RepID=A0ABP8ARD2_9MICO
MAHVFIALHVIFAVFIIGPMALLPHTGLRALRVHDAKQVRGLARSTSIFSWASLIVFVLGFAALGTADIPFTRLWVWLSVVLYAGAFVLSVFVIVPNLNRGAEEITSAGASPAVEGEKLARPAAYSAVAATAGVTTILLVVVVILMAFRP